MERTVPDPKQQQAPQFLFETPHYAVIRMALPSELLKPLVSFCIIDKKHGVVWGARSGFGLAQIACCIAEQELADGTAIAAGALARGFAPNAEAIGNGASPDIPDFLKN